MKRSCQDFCPLYSQLNPVVLDCRDCRLRYPSQSGQFILAEFLKLPQNPYGLTNRNLNSTLCLSVIAHAISSGNHVG